MPLPALPPAPQGTTPESDPWANLRQYQFKKGNRPNTGAARKTDPEVKKILIAHCPAAAEALRDIVRNHRLSPDARCRAAVIILERVYGASAQPVCAAPGGAVEFRLEGVLNDWAG